MVPVISEFLWGNGVMELWSNAKTKSEKPRNPQFLNPILQFSYTPGHSFQAKPKKFYNAKRIWLSGRSTNTPSKPSAHRGVQISTSDVEF